MRIDQQSGHARGVTQTALAAKLPLAVQAEKTRSPAGLDVHGEPLHKTRAWTARLALTSGHTCSAWPQQRMQRTLHSGAAVEAQAHAWHLDIKLAIKCRFLSTLQPAGCHAHLHLLAEHTSRICAGVRARQEHVAFAMCDDPGEIDKDIRPLLGGLCSLHHAGRARLRLISCPSCSFSWTPARCRLAPAVQPSPSAARPSLVCSCTARSLMAACGLSALKTKLLL